MNVIVLDSGPLGLLAQRPGLVLADSCRDWLEMHVRRGITILIPEIADYEVRRELLRLGNSPAVSRLDVLNVAVPDRYIPVTTQAIRLAAEFWADSRRRGLPTADPKELDSDVIIAAQAATCGRAIADIVVATSNPVHLARFVKADLWTNI